MRKRDFAIDTLSEINRRRAMGTFPISLAQLTDAHIMNNIDDFSINGPIGYGSSAVVYSAMYNPLHFRVALKMIDLDMFEHNQMDEFRRETALMALSKHPNVLRVLGSFVHGSKLYIATPYLVGGSCLDIMKTRCQDGFDEHTIATILRQVLEGLAYLHKNGHIHRDIKAGNLLVDEDGTVLLADFGVSSAFLDPDNHSERRTFVGTPCWMAPEVMEQTTYDDKADIWSFGITAIELATGHAPYAKLSPLKVIMMTLSNDPPTLVRETTKHKFSRTFKDMIDACLNKDLSKRPSAEKLLQHPFFKQAKRHDYLVRTLLHNLPPLEQRRPHKQAFRRCTPETQVDDEWDFLNERGQDRNHHIDNSNTDPSAKHHRRHISFGDAVVVVKTAQQQPVSLDRALKKLGASTEQQQQQKKCTEVETMFAGSGDAVHHAKKGRFSNNNNSNNNSKVDKHGCEPLECPQPKKNLENVVMDTSGTYASTRKTRPSVHHDNASDLSPAPRAAILASPMPSSPRSNTRPSLLLNDLTWSTDHKAGGLELNVEASEPSWAVRPRDKKALPGHWSYSDGLRPSCSTIADRHHTYGGWATQLPPATVDMNMEQELIPMSEEQKPLIHQPCRALHASSGKVGLSQCSPDISSLEREANMNDTLATMELRLQAILRENKRLQHENEELKREMERMRVPRRENGC